MSPISLTNKKSHIDWITFAAALTLCGLGLLTMDSFASPNPFFGKQLTSMGILWWRRRLQRNGQFHELWGLVRGSCPLQFSHDTLEPDVWGPVVGWHKLQILHFGRQDGSLGGLFKRIRDTWPF